jgi:hypothetical protein
MTREITRRYSITGDEVREAVLLWLRQRDMPAPGDGVDETWKWTDHGAVTLEWTDSITSE